MFFAAHSGILLHSLIYVNVCIALTKSSTRSDTRSSGSPGDPSRSERVGEYVDLCKQHLVKELALDHVLVVGGAIVF